MVTQSPEAPADVKTLSAYEQLTSRQRSFVDHYVTCLNATKAAKLAGYSERSAGQISVENMGKPLIKQAIEERLSVKANREDLTPEYVRTKIKETIPLCTQPKDRIACLELLGRTIPGTFEPVSVPGTTMNFFTVLQKLTTMTAPPSMSQPSPRPADVLTPSTLAPLPHIEKEAIDVTPSNAGASPSTPETRQDSPPPPPIHRDTVTPKIVEQNLNSTTSVVSTPLTTPTNIGRGEGINAPTNTPITARKEEEAT